MVLTLKQRMVAVFNIDIVTVPVLHFIIDTITNL